MSNGNTLREQCRNAYEHLNQFTESIKKSNIPNREDLLQVLKEVSEFLKILSEYTDLDKISDLSVFYDLSRQTQPLGSVLHDIFNKLNQMRTDINQAFQNPHQAHNIINNTLNVANTIRQRLFHIVMNYRLDIVSPKSLKKELNDLTSEIENIRDTINEQIEEINQKTAEWNEKMETTHNEILELKEEASKTIEEAKRTLEWTTASGLQDAYKERAAALRKSVHNHFRIFLTFATIGIPLLYMVIFAPYIPLRLLDIPEEPLLQVMNNEPATFMILSRIGFVIPLVILIWLLWRNYIRHKILLEEYELRAILAQNTMMVTKVLDESESDLAREFKNETFIRLLKNPVDKAYKIESQLAQEENLINKPKDLINKIKESLSKRESSEQENHENE